MKDRIKQIRTSEGLSQTKFGEILGVSRDAVANLEGGRVQCSKLHQKAICSAFHIRSEWLESGTGEMYDLNPATPDEKLAAYMGKAITLPESSLQKQILLFLASLDDDKLDLVEDWWENYKKEKAQD